MRSMPAAPPLPDLRAIVAASEWLAEREGLREQAAAWQRELPRVRRELEREAANLSRPRIWVDTIGSLAATGWRMAATAAPDAPLTILTAAAGAFGLPVAPTGGGLGVRQAEQIVRAGGPAYVKLGQFIASADGLLPAEWVQAFAWCRDRVPPMRSGVAAAIVDRELGERRRELLDFEDEPFAAASIGQVHRATLADGTPAVVKVRRRGLRARFAADVEALALVAAAAHRLHEPVRVANLPGFVELFARLALEELDFRLEALNMVELGASAHQAGLDYCDFPRPVPGMVTERVLVMERLPGVPYADAAAEYGADLDGERLLQLAIQGVLEGALVYGLFHGDLHAGNVLIDRGDRFSLVDFGICGRLTAEERAALVRFLLAFAAMDAAGQLRALEAFGALPADADRSALAAALQEEIDALPPGVTYDTLGENVGGVLRLLAANGFMLPKPLVLFFKNLLYLSGFTASVAPDADLLAQIAPVLAYFGEKYGEDLASMAG
jgi:ubiquinone biosynthesis protein